MVQARDTGQVGINSARQHVVDSAGVYRPGSFKFYGGTIMENQLADLYLARQSNGPIVVNGVHSEGSLRFLDMPNFNQDTTNLSDRTHIELNSIKHHVPTGPADGEVIRYYGNGPLIITSMDIGKQIDPVPYRIRFQSRPRAQDGPVAFRFDGTVSTMDRKALFTGRLPTDYAASYRHRASNNNLPLIVSVDNGREKPINEEDWLRVLGIVPRCWYRFGETEALAADTVDLVDFGANRLNLNGHRLATGYGPVRISNVGGTSPTPLSGTTDYYIRRINTNSIALHLTKADAIAGTNVVDITAANSGTNTIAGTTGSDGSIFDCNQRLPPIDMVPNAFPFYRRTSGFSDEWAEFASGAIDQQFFLNNVTDVDPTSDSVAFLIHFRAVTTTGVDNRYLVTLGTGATGPGGGPNVRFDANGFMKGTIDGVPSPLGGHNYTAEGDYLLVAGYDRSCGGRFTMETDKELIVHGTPSLNVGNHLRKGIGTGSTAGTLATAGFQIGLFAVFVRGAAERLIAMGTEVHRRMGGR